MVVRFVAGENAERPNARRFARRDRRNRRRCRRCRRSGLGGLGRLPAGGVALVIGVRQPDPARPLHIAGRPARPMDPSAAGLRHGCDHRRCRRSRRLPRLVLVAAFPAKCVAVAISAVIRGLSHRLVLFRVVRREQSTPMRRPVPDGEVRVSVVVPAYRERCASPTPSLASEANLTCIAGDLEIVVVDDGSPDGTADAARAPVRTRWSCSRRTLKGAAVRAGVLAAPAGRSRSPMPISPTRPISSLRSSRRSRVRRGDRQPSPRRHRHAWPAPRQCARSGAGWSTWPRA